MRHVIGLFFLFSVVPDSTWARICNRGDCRNNPSVEDEKLWSSNPREYYAKPWPAWSTTTNDQNCLFNGYRPAGGVRTVQEIKAPVAELEAATLSSMSGEYGGFATSSATAKSDAVIARLGEAERFKKVTGSLTKLSSGLGVLGVVFSILSIFTESNTSPEHILDATNKALDQLTHDVNRKFESMQKYVEQSKLDTLKKLAGRQYKSMYQGWTNCIQEPSTHVPSSSPEMECQRSAFRDNQKKFPLIAVYAKQLKNGTVDRKAIREVEIHLEVFRNYAQLIFMQLIPLIQTHREARLNETLPEQERTRSRKLHGYYVRRMRYWQETFTEYAQKAFNKIKEMHNENVCSKTFKCRATEKLYKKTVLHKIYYADRTECRCEFNEMTRGSCSFTNLVWKQRRPNGETYCIKHNYRNTCAYGNGYQKQLFSNVPANVNKWFNEKNLEYLNHIYIQKNIAVVTTYWNKQLMALLPTWKNIADANDVLWYCAIKNGVATKHANLDAAQTNLGVGDGSVSQAIIPMTSAGAGDPLTLKKSWVGGTMRWRSITDVNRMRSACVEQLAHPCDRSDKGGCAQICLKKNAQEARCLCFDGYKLKSDQKSCKACLDTRSYCANLGKNSGGVISAKALLWIACRHRMNRVHCSRTCKLCNFGDNA